MIDDRDTRESPALNPDEVRFSTAQADPAGAPVEPAGSPAAAQERGEAGDVSPLERPEVQVIGAFVGAFIVAKLLQRLFARD